MLVAARAIQGAGAVSAAVTALLADLTRSEVRTRAMAMIGLSIGLTFSVSLVLAPMIASFIGVSGLFALTGILTVISIGVVAWMTPDPEVSKLHEDTQAQPARMGEVLKTASCSISDGGGWLVGSWEEWRSWVFRFSCAASGVTGLGGQPFDFARGQIPFCPANPAC